MAPDHVVDISSDEDEFDGLSFPRANGQRQEESDDVVVVEELSAPSMKRRKQNSGSFGPVKGGASDDDDDCLVLDSDPDKLVPVVDGKGSGGGDGGDDLLIVAEKGQVGIVLSFVDVVYALMYSTRRVGMEHLMLLPSKGQILNTSTGILYSQQANVITSPAHNMGKEWTLGGWKIIHLPKYRKDGPIAKLLEAYAIASFEDGGGGGGGDEEDVPGAHIVVNVNSILTANMFKQFITFVFPMFVLLMLDSERIEYAMATMCLLDSIYKMHIYYISMLLFDCFDFVFCALDGLACRDYPHPRHLCGNFPFNSSPHEEYCDLCHCYVCDSPAPCYYWGNGNSSSNHCHSTDKEGRWKSMRQSFKQKNMVATQPQKVTYDSPFNIPPFQDPVPPFHHYPSPLLVPHSRPNLLRPCSATSISNSNAINQRRQDQPTILSYTRRLGQQPTKSCSLKSNVQNVQIESCVAGSLTTQLVYSRTRYKRVGTMRDGFASQTNRSHNIASTKNNIPSAMSENSTYATITSWRPRSPRVGQQRSQDLLGTSPGSSADQMQATVSSQFSKPTNQSSMCPPLTAADVSQKSWQDLLASVVSELGVAACRDSDIINVQQPLMVPSLSLPHDKPFSETNAGQDTQTD
ncbi:hypothetical protein MUK42_18030 [Musa troglodytarum]|uniref:Uncharacterized protein n=1 Tax=Musa troglodytarum TaxID=320322 RepID=A0A9E7HGV9_9LILI|nr:hypothetical protein MUK42_18030 [Musa troglodytarum]